MQLGSQARPEWPQAEQGAQHTWPKGFTRQGRLGLTGPDEDSINGAWHPLPKSPDLGRE